MYGIIDIGSNTMRLSCYRIVDKNPIHVFHKKYMAGLASYVEEDCLSQKGIDKAIEILIEFKKIASSVGLENLYVIATASIRNVDNTKEIGTEIKHRTGFDVEVVSGEEEARYDFIGAKYCLDEADGIVVDIGGGSTELVFFKNNEIEKAISIPIGSLNMYSKYVKKIVPKKKEMETIREIVREKLKESDLPTGVRDVVLGVGGTNRATGKLYNEVFDKKVYNKEMKCSSIAEILEDFSENKEKASRRILKIVPERIHTIIPGMIIMDEINKRYDCNRMQISSWGVREGYLLDKIDYI
jgi:exopolyphosphatase/guanosine-5'-triphosphate,3'-diphosphate pyrophosphatase